MANLIQIKRSNTTAIPAALAAGELAYSEVSGKFYIGKIDGGVEEIAGKALVDAVAALVDKTSNIDNTADLDKPVSTAQQEAIDLKISTDQKGVANGVATLDASGLVPASQLPSYVDDVIEADDVDSLPAEGEAGKIYVTTDNNNSYRWTGSVYVNLTDANKLSGADIKALYEGEADTNAFTDQLLAKLEGIEDGATGDQTGEEIVALIAAEADVNLVTDEEKAALTALAGGETALDAGTF